MAWALHNSFVMAKGQNAPFLLSTLIGSPAIAILVRSATRRDWKKAGDVRQVFTGGIVGEPLFVPLGTQQAIALNTQLGLFALQFDPVDYHDGLNIQVWRWVTWILSVGMWDDLSSFDDFEFWRDYP